MHAALNIVGAFSVESGELEHRSPGGRARGERSRHAEKQSMRTKLACDGHGSNLCAYNTCFWEIEDTWGRPWRRLGANFSKS